MFTRHIWGPLLALTSLSFTHGEQYTDPSELLATEYDFVIVGAGVGGCVLANRLTENTNFSVLLVEAGETNLASLTDQVAFLSTDLVENSPLSWNSTTTPQAGLYGRNVTYPRGHVLGGTTTINHLVWTRGSVDDYNRYANVTGDDSWSWSNMYPYLLKIEAFVPPADNHNTNGQMNPAIHNYSGPVDISLPGYPTTIDDRVFEASYEVSDIFPYNIDVNSGYPMGLGWLVSALSTDGRRVSSATAYLEPALNRSNLDVLMLTTATKLIGTESTNGSIAFNQVELATNATSERYTIEAKNEVILSAGAVGTAQILLLSGIGDPEALQTLNITPTLNNSAVGQNFGDHPQLYTNWVVNATYTFDDVFRNTTLQSELLAQWENNGTGLFVDNGVSEIGFTRVSDQWMASHNFSDPSAGIASPHIEMIPANWFLGTVQETGHYLGMTHYIVSPASRGSVTLASNDPFDQPLIDPAFLSDDFDAYAMVEGIKQTMAFLNTSAWDGYVVSPYGDLANATTDEDLLTFARNNTGAGYHPFGTAMMAPESSDEGVTTPDLRVKGTTGLRIVDASVLPYVISGHLQACLYASAERAADIIKATYSS